MHLVLHPSRAHPPISPRPAPACVRLCFRVMLQVSAVTPSINAPFAIVNRRSPPHRLGPVARPPIALGTPSRSDPHRSDSHRARTPIARTPIARTPISRFPHRSPPHRSPRPSLASPSLASPNRSGLRRSDPRRSDPHRSGPHRSDPPVARAPPIAVCSDPVARTPSLRPCRLDRIVHAWCVRVCVCRPPRLFCVIGQMLLCFCARAFRVCPLY